MKVPLLSRVRVGYRWVSARYGTDPLRLLALLACFALAGYAASRVVIAGIWVGFVTWFVGAALIHDLVLYPLYAIADVAAQRPAWHRRRSPESVRWPPWINYLRVPTGLSGLLLLIWFPLVLQRSKRVYKASTALDPSPYLGRWLLVTGALFAASAITYAIRLRRHASPRRPRSQAPRRTGG